MLSTKQLLFYGMLGFMGMALASVVAGLLHSVLLQTPSPLYAQKAMRVRILCQGIAIFLLGVLTFIN